MASRTVQVEVTEQDIAEGQRNDCTACPVARAIRRLLRAGYAAQATEYWIGANPVGPRKQTVYPATRADAPTRQFIRAFDCGCEVRPFTFSLDLPEEVLA